MQTFRGTATRSRPADVRKTSTAPPPTPCGNDWLTLEPLSAAVSVCVPACHSQNPLPPLADCCHCCPARAAARFFKNPGTPKTPKQKRIVSNLDKEAFLSRYTPCKYNKHNAKGQGTSLSCLQAGYTVATGKYGIISVDQTTGQSVGWVRDEKTGKVALAKQAEVSVGDGEGESEAAAAPTTAAAAEDVEEEEDVWKPVD